MSGPISTSPSSLPSPPRSQSQGLSLAPQTQPSGTPFDPDESTKNDGDDCQVTASPQSFHAFKNRVYAFDSELLNFLREARQLGRSVDVLRAVQHLREQLQRVLVASQYNASQLFHDINPRFSPKKSKRSRRAVEYQLKTYELLNPEKLFISVELRALHQRLDEILDRTHEFSEFTEHSIRDNAIVNIFMNDLDIWAQKAEKYEGQIDSFDIRRYLHALLVELGGHLAEVTLALNFYITTGLPTILNEQKRSLADLLTVTTAATFFSAVAAGMIQLTYGIEDQTTAVLNINSLLFCSLVFSIGAALNSLMCLAWKQTVYGSRKSLLARCITRYFRACPFVFLVVSIITFSGATVYIAVSTQQTFATKAVTVAATFITMLGLLAAALFLVIERRHGNLFLKDSLSPPLAAGVDSVFSKLSLQREDTLPFSMHPSPREQPDDSASTKFTWNFSLFKGSKSAEFATAGLPKRTSTRVRPQATAIQKRNSAHGSLERSPAELWKFSFKRILFMNTALRNQPWTPQKTPPGVGWCFGLPVSTRQQDCLDSERKSQLGSFMVKYCFPLANKHGTPQHLQFSHTGDRLAAARNFQGVHIYAVGSERSKDVMIKQRPGLAVVQVAWLHHRTDLLAVLVQLHQEKSDSGTKEKERFKVEVYDLEAEAHPKLVILPSETFTATRSAISWTSDDLNIFCIADCYLVTLRLDTLPVIWRLVETSRFQIPDVELRGVAVDPTDSTSGRLILLAKVPNVSANSTVRSRPERQIIVYDSVNQRIENIVPVVGEPRSAQMSRDQREILVGFKGKCPPQLWHLYFKYNMSSTDVDVKLSLRTRYQAPPSSSFTGAAYFSGNEELILALSTEGQIMFWSRGSAALLYSIQTDNVHASLSYVCWNRTMHPTGGKLMLASGSIDGVVNVWETELEFSGSPLQGEDPRSRVSPKSSQDTHSPVLMDGPGFHTDLRGLFTPPSTRTQPTQQARLELPGSRELTEMLSRWGIPVPDGFLRSAGKSKQTFAPFGQFVLLELGSTEPPRLPPQLQQHDIHTADWARLMQDISRVWAETMDPTRRGIAQKQNAIFYLLNWWNVCFCQPRGFELVMYIGPERFSYDPGRLSVLIPTNGAGGHGRMLDELMPWSASEPAPIPITIQVISTPRQKPLIGRDWLASHLPMLNPDVK